MIRISKSDGDAPSAWRLPRWAQLLALAALGLLLLAPILLVPEPPLLDYPNHLASAYVLAHVHDANLRFSQYFSRHWGPYPYITMELALLGLQKIMPVEAAGRVFCGLAVLAVPAGLWWLYRRAVPENAVLALLAGAVAYDQFLLQGFLQFEFALGLAFFTIGTWFWYIERPSLRRWLLLFACVVATFFSHLIVFATIALILGSYCLFSRQGWRRLASTALLFLPGVAMAAWLRTGIAQDHSLLFRDWQEKLDVLIWTAVHGYAHWLDWLIWLAVAACAFIAALGNRRLRVQWPWIGVIAVLLVAFLVLPDELGATWEIDIRMLPVAFLLLPLIAIVGNRRRVIAAVFAVLMVLRIVTTVGGMRKQYALLGAARNSFQVIAPNSVVLPQIEYPDGMDPIVNVYRHYWAWAAIRRGAIVPYLFQVPGQTVLHCPSCADAPEGFYEEPSDDPPDWEQVRSEYDYLWLWGLRRFDPTIRSFADLVYESGPVRVYRVRKLPDE